MLFTAAFMTSETASMKVRACSRCMRTTPSNAQYSEDDRQACTYMVNDCQGRGEALVELQTLNSTAAALHQGDWQGKIDLRASKQGCGPRFPLPWAHELNSCQKPQMRTSVQRKHQRSTDERLKVSHI